MHKILLLLPLLAACSTVEPQGGAPMPLIGSSGQTIGTVRAWQTAGGVSFRIDARGLPHGVHGIHVHPIGRCDPPDFSTAGTHWNPSGREHGMNNPKGPHDELWQHSSGCRSWFRVRRDTRTHAILESAPVRPVDGGVAP